MRRYCRSERQLHDRLVSRHDRAMALVHLQHPASRRMFAPLLRELRERVAASATRFLHVGVRRIDQRREERRGGEVGDRERITGEIAAF